jgi:hypothetical protein
MTTVLEQVSAPIESLSPAQICDDCITERLGLSARQHADHKTRASSPARDGSCAV